MYCPNIVSKVVNFHPIRVNGPLIALIFPILEGIISTSLFSSIIKVLIVSKLFGRLRPLLLVKAADSILILKKFGFKN